jgi:hypothetical protein
MSEENNRTEKPFVDRRKNRDGITSGGRRKSDRRYVEAGSRKTRVVFATSCILSTCILIWAFSLPFRGDNAVATFANKDANNAGGLEASTVSRTETDGQYLQEVMFLEEDLKRQLAKKRKSSKSPRNLTGADEAKAAWNRGLEKRYREAKLLADLSEEKVIEGTIEWHAQMELQEYLEDAPQ